MNIGNVMKLKSMMTKFQKNHPKIPMFLQAAGQSIAEGTVIEVSITTTDGRNLCTNMKVTAEDLELLEELKQIKN
jgi:hypothetical protein